MISYDYNNENFVQDSMFESSIVAEHEGNLELAFSEKIQAIDELVEIMKSKLYSRTQYMKSTYNSFVDDDDRDRRKAVKDRILRETKRAEDLKEKSSLQQSTIMFPIEIGRLLFFCSAKSEENTELFQAFQHCKAGNKLADENQFRSALDKFDIGLASMLEIYRSTIVINRIHTKVNKAYIVFLEEKNVEQRKSLHDTVERRHQHRIVVLNSLRLSLFRFHSI